MTAAGSVPASEPSGTPPLGPGGRPLRVLPLVAPLPDGPALAGPAGTGRFLVEGASVAVTGERRGTIRSVWIQGREVVRDLRIEPGTAVNVVAYPGLVRRERVGPSGATTETIVAGPTLPLVAVQVASATGLGVRFTLEAGASPARIGGAAVRVDLGDGLEAAVVVSPPESKLRVVAGAPDGDDLEVEVEPAASGPLTLLIAAAPRDRIEKVLSGGAHLEVHAHAAAQARLDDGLVLATGVRELDDGIHWARVRLATGVHRAHHVRTSDVLLAGLAAASVGDARAARLAGLHAHARAHEEGVGWNEAALLASHLAMTLGEPGLATRLARALIDASHSGRAHPALAAPVADALADALRHAAPDALIAAVRTLARAGGRTAAPHAAHTGRGLPMAGRHDDRFGRLAALLAAEPLEPAGSGSAPPGSEATALDLAGQLRVDTDAGWAHWRGTLAAGLEGGPEGPGSWDPAHGAGGAPVAGATAGLLLGLVHGLLGWAPDAPVGRARIAPRLPRHLTALRAEGLTVGTARISLAYERAAGAHRFELVPERGGVPPQVVFEPAVPGGVAEVLVDGARAALDRRPSKDRTVVPVQLALDGPRSVEIVSRA